MFIMKASNELQPVTAQAADIHMSPYLLQTFCSGKAFQNLYIWKMKSLKRDRQLNSAVFSLVTRNMSDPKIQS